MVIADLKYGLDGGRIYGMSGAVQKKIFTLQDGLNILKTLPSGALKAQAGA